MEKMVLEIEGMSCGMCESHINDTIRRQFAVKKVSSSHDAPPLPDQLGCRNGIAVFVVFLNLSVAKPDNLMDHCTDGAVVGDNQHCGSIFLVNFFQKHQNFFAVFESSAPVGSSQSSRSGFLISALAMAQRCCCPPES